MSSSSSAQGLIWNDGTSYELMIYKKILWPLGIWALNKGEIFSEIRLILAAVTQAATCICLYAEIIRNCRGVEDILDLFVLSVFAILACVKGLIVRFHLNEVHSVLQSSIKDWWIKSYNDNCKYRGTMESHASLGRIVCFSLMAPASGGTLSWIVFALPLPIFIPENYTGVIRNFPLQTACTFESIAHTNFYYFIFVIQVYQLIATCLGNCGNDVFFFGLSMHVCGQLEILKDEFERVEYGDDHQEQFKHLVQRHSHLIDQARKLENTFHLIILAQLIMSGVLICIMGVQVIIALKIGDLFSGIKACMVLSSLMSQLFLYSYGGDYLTFQNESIAYSIYNSNWFNHSSLMKDISFVIFRSNTSIYITAGKFFYMTLGTFMHILKVSVSYMSVLRIAMDV